MKICVVAPSNKTVYNFRGDLIKKMVANGAQVVVVGPNKDFIDDVMALGVSKHIVVPLTRNGVSLFQDIRYCRSLAKIFKEEKIDVIFSYTVKPVIYSGIAAGMVGIPNVYLMLSGIGRIFASHSLKHRVIQFLMGFLYRRSFHNATRVIFQNQEDRELFVKLGYLPYEKTAKVDGSGVNLTRFHVEDDYTLPEELFFLMTSRVIREKGVFEFAKAAKIVKTKYPKARFVLLGGFDNAPGAIQQRDLDPYINDGTIEFPGRVKDVLPYLKQARFLVLPTYYYEGIPRSILEGMAMGLPIIATNWRGCHVAVVDGENGFLVPIQDPETLAKRIVTLIENPELAVRMGKESLKRCQLYFDVEIINKRMFELMDM